MGGELERGHALGEPAALAQPCWLRPVAAHLASELQECTPPLEGSAARLRLRAFLVHLREHRVAATEAVVALLDAAEHYVRLCVHLSLVFVCLLVARLRPAPEVKHRELLLRHGHVYGPPACSLAEDELGVGSEARLGFAEGEHGTFQLERRCKPQHSRPEAHHRSCIEEDANSLRGVQLKTLVSRETLFCNGLVGDIDRLAELLLVAVNREHVQCRLACEWLPLVQLTQQGRAVTHQSESEAE
mmetsp:Transcript_21156/g.54167  ORF Transcript_21156/g.54167 Transcript_21156/m.54167 type:complete len:244 (-) Transcript_21156:512-1243(-)